MISLAFFEVSPITRKRTSTTGPEGPQTISIILTDTGEPTVRFEILSSPARATSYAVPAEATARFELDAVGEPPYVASDGSLALSSVAPREARGTFSFTASRAGGQTVTVEGSFTAESDVDLP